MKHAILNRDFGEVRTVVVLGVGRGGTSLIAGCLRALGIAMGRNVHPLKHEWSPVVYMADGRPDLAATYRAIAAMDHEFELWGWKSPRDFGQLDKIASLLRDPGFIFVTRDILESALSGLAYQNMPLELGLYEAAAVYQSLADRLRFLPWPTLFVSYADALVHPQPLVDLLCSFLNIHPAAALRERAASFIQPGKHAYRFFDAKPDDPAVPIPEEELRSDAESLAAEVSKRYGAEYLQGFATVMADTRIMAQQFGSMLEPLERAGLVAELVSQLCRITVSLSWDDFPDAQDLCEAVEASLRDRTSHERFPAALSDLLDGIASAARHAEAKLDGRASHTGLSDFQRVYYVLQVLLRVREVMRRGLYLVKFQSAPRHT